MGELFGTFVRSRRQALDHERGGYSIRKLADRIRVHHSFLSKIERGEPACLSERKLVALALELGEDPDLLLAMNGKVAEDVRRAILHRPALFSRLIRELRNAPDEEIKSNRALVRDRTRLAQRLSDKGRLLRQALESRRAAEMELKLVRQAIHNGPTATVLVDAKGCITYANPAFFRLWGFASEDQVLGRHRHSFWAEPQSYPDYFETMLIDGRSRTIERKARRADGRTFLARVQIMPYTDVQGRPLGALASIEDVTRERALVQGLVRSNRWLRQFVENMDDVLFTMGADGLFTYISPSVERGFGLKPEEVVGRHFSQTVWPADRELAEVQVRLVLQGRSAVFECRSLAADGSPRWVRVSLAPRLGEGGRVMGIQGVSVDISGRKKAETVLDGLLRGMRQPLDAALGLLEQALDERRDTVRQKRLQAVREELLHLRGLDEHLKRHWPPGGLPATAAAMDLDRTRNGFPPDARSGTRRGAVRPARPRVLLVEAPVPETQAAGALLDRLGFLHTRCQDPAEACLLLARRSYALLLLDLDQPGLDAAALVRRLRGEGGGLSRRAVLLGLAWPGRQRCERDCVAAGLDGVLHKPLTAGRLAEALELVPGLDIRGRPCHPRPVPDSL
jgi:PAS domain S-box-containing protein